MIQQKNEEHIRTCCFFPWSCLIISWFVSWFDSSMIHDFWLYPPWLLVSLDSTTLYIYIYMWYIYTHYMPIKCPWYFVGLSSMITSIILGEVMNSKFLGPGPRRWLLICLLEHCYLTVGCPLNNNVLYVLSYAHKQI